MKDPYGYLSGGVSFIFVDLNINGATFDILPDFLGFVFLAYGVHLLPAFHNLKRWSKNFTFILIVMSFFVELDKWQGAKFFGQIGEQLLQFLLIVFMYHVFQLLLHIHENKPLESKTFKTYQKIMTFMLCGFVIQAFSINAEVFLRENLYFLGAALQLVAFFVFTRYGRVASIQFKEMANSRLK